MPRLASWSAYRHWIVGGIVVAGLAVSTLVWRIAERNEQLRIEEGFRRRAETQLRLAQQRVNLYVEMIHSLRNFFIGQRQVGREEFSVLSHDLLSRYPAVQALQWVPLVTADERAAFEQIASLEHGLIFQIKERDPATDRLVPARPRPEYTVILFTEPLESNEVVLGYDISTAPTAASLMRARTIRELVVTQQFRLAQAATAEDEFGLVFIMPVFTAPEEGGALVFAGFVQAVFRVETMLSHAHRARADEALHLYYLDLDSTDPKAALLYANEAGRELLRDTARDQVVAPQAGPGDFHEVIEVGGRRWQLLIRLSPRWRQAQATFVPGLFLAGGVALTLLAALFTRTLIERTRSIEQEVAERTHELETARRLLEDDIRQRMQVEQALKSSEARLQAILDHSPNSIFVKDLNGRYVLVNRHLSQMWRRPPGEFTGRSDAELFPPDVAAKFSAADRRMLEAGSAIKYEVTTNLPGTGGLATTIVQKFPLRDAEGRIYGMGGISTDITDRKQAEAELQESRRQLSNLISQLPGAAFRCQFDDHLTALFASEGMLAITGYPAEDFVSGHIHIAQLTVPADRPLARQALADAIGQRRPFEIEYRLRHREGAEKWVLVRGRPIYDDNGQLRFLEGLAIDVTALKHAEHEKIAMERRLLAAQKLESLGVLAGGIAHDFNNILTSVLVNASLARHDASGGRPIDRSLEQIEHAARRAADLCQQMLAYAGKGKIITAAVDLGDLVRDTSVLLEATINKNTRLDLHLAPGVPPVLADQTQLRQIVMNLVINADDAIGGRPGTITVRTFAQEADATLLHSALGHPELPPGTYAGLEVTDNGSGMPPETLARIFEPFFTTKFSGRGLGLSAVLGIVQSHHGALFVESTVGQGSTFRLLLPATGKVPAAASPQPASSGSPAQLRGTALVVDDEEAVRSIAATVLEVHGAATLTAASGEAALKLLRDPAHRVSVVLLDMTMPGLSGEETLRQLREIHPRLPVIFMSGYSEGQAMQRGTSLGVTGFIQKPFEISALLAKVRPHLT